MIIIQLTQIDLHTVGRGVQLTRLMSSSWTVTLPLRGEENWVCFKQLKCLSKILSLQWHLLGWCKWFGILWFIREVCFLCPSLKQDRTQGGTSARGEAEFLRSTAIQATRLHIDAARRLLVYRTQHQVRNLHCWRGGQLAAWKQFWHTCSRKDR